MKKRILSLALVLAMLAAWVPAAFATTQQSAVNWVNQQVQARTKFGTGQCVDLVKAYCSTNFGWTPTGYAKDYRTISLPSGWTRTQRTNGYVPAPGDIAVYVPGYVSEDGKTRGNANGHVGIIVEATSSYFIVADQRPSSVPYTATTRQTNFAQIWGYIRPNYSNVPANAPSAPSVSVNGSNVTVSWNDVANETSYDVYLVQSPWGWGDIKYSKSVSANVTSCTFSGVANGEYRAFVIARPNADSVQSPWSSVSVKTPITPGTPQIKVSSTELLEGETVTISWNATSNASKYLYYITEFPEGYAYENSVKTGTTANTSISFSNLPSGHYTVFVHAVSSTDTWSTQSNWLSFDIRNDDYAASKVIVSNGHMYALYDATETWTFARDLCAKLGGHLATVTSASENTVIKELIQSGKGDGYWLGGYNYTVEGYDSSGGPYKWVTGESFGYTNWASGEPSGSGSKGTKEHYLEVRKSYGYTWNDMPNRSSNNSGFILEIDNLSTIKPTYTGTYGNSQYQVFDATMTWTEAKAFCESLGGHLATAQSGAEYNAIASIMTHGNRAWYFLGGTRTSASGAGKWLDGTTISKSDIKWSSFNWGDYLFAYKNGSGLGWMKSAYHPVSDVKHIGFICEIDAKNQDEKPQNPESKPETPEDPTVPTTPSEPGAEETPSSESEDPSAPDVSNIPAVHFSRVNVYHQDQFTDVKANQWFTPTVASAFEMGLVRGDSSTTYNPYGNVTVAEAITMAARIHSIYTTGKENFVQSGKWYQVYLDYAYDNGIISTAYYNSDVNQNATRAQFAEIFANALPGDGLYPMNSVADNAIPDVKMSANYAASVYKLYRAGILAGSDRLGTFNPDTYITRAEAATILARMGESSNRMEFSMG